MVNVRQTGNHCQEYIHRKGTIGLRHHHAPTDNNIPDNHRHLSLEFTLVISFTTTGPGLPMRKRRLRQNEQQSLWNPNKPVPPHNYHVQGKKTKLRNQSPWITKSMKKGYQHHTKANKSPYGYLKEIPSPERRLSGGRRRSYTQASKRRWYWVVHLKYT